MALTIDLEIKNELLNTPFVDIGSDKLYLSIPSATGTPQNANLPHVEIEFNISTNSRLKLNLPVHIVVPANTTVDTMYISTIPMTNGSLSNTPKDTIQITGDDIVTYNTNGIHLVEEINIALTTL